MESIKPNSHSQWLSSHFSPENCIWLKENIAGVEQSVKQMLKLIEEDENSSANKSDDYQKKPEFIARVEEFSTMHHLLAERYNHLIGDLRKNLLPQVPESAPHQASVYFTPYQKTDLHKSEQPIGFDLFLSSGDDNSTDVSLKEGSESSSSLSSYSDLESFNTPMNKHQAPSINGVAKGLNKRFELETELVGAEENEVLLKRIMEYEEELRVSSEKFRLSEEEIARLKVELEKGESVILHMGNLQAEHDSAQHEIKMLNGSLEMEKIKVVELQKRVTELENQIFDSGCEIGTLEEELKMTKEKLVTSEEELKMTKEKLVTSEEEIAMLKDEFLNKISQGTAHQLQLQSQLEVAQREMALLETNIDLEKGQVLELQEKLLRYLADINSLHIAQEKSSLEKEKLQSDVGSLLEQKALLEARFEESELKSRLLENEITQCKAEKLEMKSLHETQESRWRADIEKLREELKQKIELVENSNEALVTLKIKYETMMEERNLAYVGVDALKEEVGLQAIEIKEMDRNMHVLNLEHLELIGALKCSQKLTDELKLRVEELEKEVDYRAEEKRAVIRQLCFSLEHYRTGYHELREAYVGHKRNAVLAL
ncbi:hypothetical protein LguiA_034738 [Lonicera macranthoides]